MLGLSRLCILNELKMCPFIEDTVDLRKMAKIENINENSKLIFH